MDIKCHLIFCNTDNQVYEPLINQNMLNPNYLPT